MTRRVQFYDVKMRLNDNIQQRIYRRDSDANSLSFPSGMVVTNNLPFDYFKKSIQDEGIYFSHHVERDQKDEFRYKDFYEDALSKEQSGFCNSVYRFSLYDSGHISSLHFSGYAEGSKKTIGLSVEYYFPKLIKGICTAIDNGKGKPGNKEGCTLYCGKTCYLTERDSRKQTALFDEDEWMAPFFLKPMSTQTDKEYRLCITNAACTGDHLLVPVQDYYNCIKRIIVRDENKIIQEVRKFLDTTFNNTGIEFKGEDLHNGYFAFVKISVDLNNEAALKNDYRDLIATHINNAAINPQPSIAGTTNTKDRKACFSGVFDSMKQRYLLMGRYRKYYYQCYNTTLKLEMLLCGKMMITDASLFDGMLFTRMIDNGDFRAFCDCAISHDLLEVRIRGDAKDRSGFIEKIYGKPLFYSSMDSYVLAKQVEQIGQRIRDSQKTATICANSDSYWEYIRMNVFDHGYDDVMERMKQYFNCFNDSANNPIFVSWGTMPNFNQYLLAFLRHIRAFQTVERACQELVAFDELKPLVKDIQDAANYANAKNQFQNVSNYRTYMVDCVNRILAQADYLCDNELISVPDRKQIKEKCREIINDFNYAYNGVIILQHGCDFTDDADNPMDKYMEIPSTEIITIDMNPDFLNLLEGCDWSGFSQILSDSGIGQAREAFLSLLNTAVSPGINDMKQFTENFKEKALALNYAMEDFWQNNGMGHLQNNRMLFSQKKYCEDRHLRLIGQGCRLKRQKDGANDICFYFKSKDGDERLFRLSFDGKETNRDIVISIADKALLRRMAKA